jgi:hypothetical protein
VQLLCNVNWKAQRAFHFIFEFVGYFLVNAWLLLEEYIKHEMLM